MIYSNVQLCMWSLYGNLFRSNFNHFSTIFTLTLNGLQFPDAISIYNQFSNQYWTNFQLQNLQPIVNPGPRVTANQFSTVIFNQFPLEQISIYFQLRLQEILTWWDRILPGITPVRIQNAMQNTSSCHKGQNEFVRNWRSEAGCTWQSNWCLGDMILFFIAYTLQFLAHLWVGLGSCSLGMGQLHSSIVVVIRAR